MIVRREQQRTTKTPNGVMTTLASPTLGDGELALWRVAMPPGQPGPVHRFDGEQIWSVVAGGARLEVEDQEFALRAGDTAVLPAGATRRLTAHPEDGLEAIVTSRGGVQAQLADGTDRGTPPWIA